MRDLISSLFNRAELPGLYKKTVTFFNIKLEPAQ